MFIGTPWYMKLIGVSGFGAFTSVLAFPVWTKHCHVQDLPVTDPLFRSSNYKKFNPKGSPSLSDVCVRRIPLYLIRPDLLEDDKRGGGKLVEAFCSGVYGSKAYTIQRLIHSRNKPPSSETSALIQSLSQATTSTTASIDPATQPTQTPPLSQSLTSRISSLFSSYPSPPPSNPSLPPTLQTPSPTASPPPTEIWSRSALQTSSFPTSTIITNHFLVLSRSPPHTILLRCGDSPLTNPTSPRESDGLFELSATTNYDRGYAEFTLKSIFYNGELSDEERAKGVKPMGPTMDWLHRQYTKLWMESGAHNVRLSKWRSLEKQRQLIQEEMKRKDAEVTGEEEKRLLEEKR